MLDGVIPSGNSTEMHRRRHLMQPSFYWDFVTRRWAYIFIPFVVISVLGFIVARTIPAAYFSEGKLIVQPQQISSELVKATVTGVAQDRLQVIQQRTMSRDSVLEIADKFGLFEKARRSLSTNDFVELVKRNIKISVIELTPEFGQRSRGINPPLVFSVGFEYSDADTAQKVANELIQRFMDQDIRDRKERAFNTTKFMTDEYEKLRAENAVLDAKVAEQRAKLRTSSTSTNGDPEVNQLTQLREEYAQKTAVYSDQHPLMKSLKRQIQQLESAKLPEKIANASDLSSLEMLNAQQEAARKTLEQAASKVTAALAGENLEKNQQSEKLEILETATVPQQPTKPNSRLKVAASAVVAAFLVGLAVAFLVETLDTAIRSSSDIAVAVDRSLVMTIPYISVRAESRRNTSAKIVVFLAVLAAVAALAVFANPISPQLKALVGKTESSLSK